MVLRASVRRERLLAELGTNIRRWRRVNGMSASDLSERAGVTRTTLRGIESGTGAAQLDSFVAVLAALGIAGSVVEAADPYRNESARIRIDEMVRQGGTL